MSYAAYTDVNALIVKPLAFTITDSSDPLDDTVDSWLAWASGRIDAALLTAGYATVPATGSNDLILLGGWVARYGAVQVAIYLQVYDTVPESIRRQWDGFETFLSDLASGAASLVDQSPRRGRTSVSSATRNDAYHEANG